MRWFNANDTTKRKEDIQQRLGKAEVDIEKLNVKLDALRDSLESFKGRYYNDRRNRDSTDTVEAVGSHKVEENIKNTVRYL